MCFEEKIIPGFEAGAQKMFEQIDTTLRDQVMKNVGRGSINTKPPEMPSDQKEHLQDLLNKKKFDEALMKALGAQDLDLVTWLCKRVDPGIMHDSELLSQTVLICLLQQLGTNLESDTQMKLEWLKQIALNIDKSNADIAAYAPQVIKRLQSTMQEFQVSEAGRQFRTELALITRVL